MDGLVGDQLRGRSGFQALALRLTFGNASGDAEVPDQWVAAAARTLCRWGAAEHDGGGLRFVAPWTPGLLTLFAPLMDLLQVEVVETTLPGAPVHMIAILASAEAGVCAGEQEGRLEFVSGGQGGSKGEALLSAFGELAERVTLWTTGENDPRIVVQGGGDEVKLGPVLGFSERQEAALARCYPALRKTLTGDGLDWNRLCRRRVAVSDLATRKPGMVPALGVLSGEGRGLGLGGLRLVSTSGMAVYASSDEAIRRAVEEAVERDVVAQAWYNRLGITVLKPSIWSQFIHRNCCEYLLERERLTDFLVLDTELDTHVILAVSREPSGLGACVGSAAATTVSAALSSALGELLQSERSRGLTIRMLQSAGAAQLPDDVRYGATTSIDEDLAIRTALPADAEALSRVFGADDLVDSCIGQGIRLKVFDATHPLVRVPCAKVMSEDLCSWQPRYGKRRLSEGVVCRGLSARAQSEEMFECRPFPF